ncbi:MAG: protein kinase [Myxococcota bacterium]
MPTIVSAVPPTMPEILPAGTPVGHHVIDSVLRDGGMATIYLAHHERTDGRVAVKVLHTQYIHQPDFVARFDREATLMGRLSGCPQIVSVRDVGTLPDGRRFLVMDFVRGHDLRDEIDQLRARDETMELGRAVSLMRDVAAGLAAAHRMEVVHRDVKPSNIMLVQSAGRELAKLLDFGISADLAESGRKQDLTAGGTVIGTTRYMAPEQAAGISNVASVDIWAMGVLLIEMLTGEPPPKKGWGARGPDLSGLPARPPALRTLLEEMVQPDSTQRLQSAAIAEQRLLAVLPEVNAGVSLVAPIDPSLVHAREGAGTAMVPPPAARADKTVVAPPPSRGRNPLLLGMLTAVVLMGCGTLGWWAVETFRAPAEASVVAAADETDAPTETPVSEPEPAPEPDAKPEPEPAPAPEPTLVIDAQPQPAPTKPAAPSSEKPRPKAKPRRSCDQQKQAARDAATLGTWKVVLSNTKQASCWSAAKSERERLRVRAYLKLGQYKKCESLGQESNDPAVSGLVNICRDKMGT